MNQVPENLSDLSRVDLEHLFVKTGSKRVAAELRRFAPPVPNVGPVNPIVAPRPAVARSENYGPDKGRRR